MTEDQERLREAREMIGFMPHSARIVVDSLAAILRAGVAAEPLYATAMALVALEIVAQDDEEAPA